MSQDKRTLTDELNSVLIAHSLQAPEPARTIEQVLARAAAGSQKPVRARPQWLRVPKQMRVPKHLNAVIAAAVVVGLLFLGTLQLRQQAKSAKSATGSSAARGALGTPAFGGAASAASSADSVGLTFCAPVGAEISGLRFGSQSPTVVRLSCALKPDAPAAATSAPQALAPVAGSSQTATADDIGPSEVLVSGRVPITLISPSQQLQVDTVTASGHTVTIRALDSTGNLHELIFTSKNGISFPRTSDTTIAKACTLGDLSVALVKPASVPGGALVGLVTVTDVSGGAPCALSGYPDIQAAAAEIPSAAVIDAVHTLAGPDGGVKKSTAVPVIVLASGQRASAIVESLAKTSPPCGSTGILTISLPQIGVVRDYADFPLGLCNLEVHPLVPGSSGSD
jgi:hypothetical protein